MAWKFLPYLAAAAFAAILFRLFSRGGDQARSTEESASGNDGTAGGASSTHTSTEGQEVATSSGYDGTAEGQDQAGSTEESVSGNDGTAGGASSTDASTEGQEVATSSGYDGTAEGQDQARSTEESVSGNDGTAGGASSTDASTEGQKKATYDYEVFLSFRGPDTRQGFTDFLYHNLKDVGIRTFRDDDELNMGGEIGLELFQAIKQSKILIPIFSKGYASSVWCLKELVRMVKCQENENEKQKIMPIFYDVSPSEVRHQTGNYKEAFSSHEKQYDKDTICKWKATLKTVATKKGWDLLNKTARQEGEFARDITEKVFGELKKACVAVTDCLVNVDNHVNAIKERIGAQTSETQIIGIHGMGGIGKTTIAKVIYNELSSNFEASCFLSNIRETSKCMGITCLQNQLISDILRRKRMDKQMHINNKDEGIETIKSRLSNKRVLLILDDVEEENHIDAFVVKGDWFSKGSKIIITTRNKYILCFPKVNCSYEVQCMDPVRSLQLFSKHAFRRDSPLDEDIEQSNKAVSIAGGLPLALEVIGSLLSRIKKEEWDDKLEEVRSVPLKDVFSKLKISYDALCYREKHIFLDIACLFIGYEKDIVIYYWDKSTYSPKGAMDVLENMSLIKINHDNKIWMHDQLRDFGREMVRLESGLKKGKQSRVWDPKQGSDFMRRPKRNKEVEALRIEFDDECQVRFTYEGFKSLSDLRFLGVHGSLEDFHAEERLLWHESLPNVITTNENLGLLPELRWLSWRDIPPTFNIANLSMEDVVILDISSSDMTDDWKGWSHMNVMKNLKVLDLSDCCDLKRLPDELCEDLISLEYLSLASCIELKRLPKTIGNLTSLIQLDISNMIFEELPDSIGKLQNLKILKMEYCYVRKIPDSIGKLQNLKIVKMMECYVGKIPDAFWTLEKVEEIECQNWYRDEPIYGNIGDCIYKNQSLRILIWLSMDLYELPRLPESLIILQLDSLCMDTYPDLSNLTNLKKLDLTFGYSDRSSCGHVEDPLPQWIGNLRKLECLALCFRWSGPYEPTDRSFLDRFDAFQPPMLPSSLSSLHLYHCKTYADCIKWAYGI